MAVRRISLSEDQLKDLMKQAVNETLTSIGIETTDPLEMQRDFQHLRDWRMAVDAVQGKSIMTLIGVLVAGAAGLAWLGLRAVFNN